MKKILWYEAVLNRFLFGLGQYIRPITTLDLDFFSRAPMAMQVFHSLPKQHFLAGRNHKYAETVNRWTPENLHRYS